MIESAMFGKSYSLPGVVLVALLLVVATSACGGGDGTSSPNTITIVPPSGDATQVGIVVGNQVLNGWLYGDESDTLVILSHMRPNDQTAWEPFAKELAENGYAALTFDFRGYGISPGPQDFATLDDDLRTVVSFMHLRGYEHIFLVGASMGGTTSLVVASDIGKPGDVNIAGVVAISAPAEFQGQNAAHAIFIVTAPIYLIAAEEDTAAMVSLQELVDSASQPVASDTFSGGEHGTAMLEGAQAADVRARIIQFLDENAD